MTLTRRTLLGSIAVAATAGCLTDPDERMIGTLIATVITDDEATLPDEIAVVPSDDERIAAFEPIQLVLEEALADGDRAERRISQTELNEYAEVTEDLDRYDGDDDYPHGYYVEREDTILNLNAVTFQ